MESPYLSNQEAADYLGMSTNTLNSWRQRRQGPKYTKFGSIVKYHINDLDEYARSKTVEPARAAS